MYTEFYAHSIKGENPEKWQMLRNHLTATAKNAASFATAFDSENWSFLCGLFHDLGKYSQEFQKRLQGGKIRVDHSLAGAVEAINFLETHSFGAFDNILAHVISGHHTGLADGIPEDTNGISLNERLRKKSIPDYSAWEHELKNCLPASISSLPPFPKDKNKELTAFSLSFWTRMLYSCLVDLKNMDRQSDIWFLWKRA